MLSVCTRYLGRAWKYGGYKEIRLEGKFGGLVKRGLIAQTFQGQGHQGLLLWPGSEVWKRGNKLSNCPSDSLQIIELSLTGAFYNYD